jgi:hypothetical protein
VAVVSAIVVLALAVGQTLYYHVQHAPALERQIRLATGHPDTIDASLRSVDLPDNTDTYFIGQYIPDINVPISWINYLTTADPATLRTYTFDGLGSRRPRLTAWIRSAACRSSSIRRCQR